MSYMHDLRGRIPELESPPRLGIVIPLDRLREEMNLYLKQRGGTDDLLPRLLLSDLLEWMRKKQQSDDGEINARR